MRKSVWTTSKFRKLGPTKAQKCTTGKKISRTGDVNGFHFENRNQPKTGTTNPARSGYLTLKSELCPKAKIPE